MSWLNYHHLYYFWMVAREGSIAGACARLLLTQPTISGQLRQLERACGVQLFRRAGRNLALTEAGRDVYQYADEIFKLGLELQDSLRGLSVGHRARLDVGITDAFPKMVARRILEPALLGDNPIQLVCHEGSPERLLAQLALHQLDLVLADSPAPAAANVRAFSHLLGECGVSFCASPKLAAKLRRQSRKFPQCLQGAPVLLPFVDSALRKSLDHWLEQNDLRTHVCGEFADSALMKTFGETGVGVFVVAAAIEADVRRQYRVKVLGRIKAVCERFYLISVERKLKQPIVATIANLAREKVFA